MITKENDQLLNHKGALFKVHIPNSLRKLINSIRHGESGHRIGSAAWIEDIVPMNQLIRDESSVSKGILNLIAEYQGLNNKLWSTSTWVVHNLKGLATGRKHCSFNDRFNLHSPTQIPICVSSPQSTFTLPHII
uniref:Uncharacterized protein n=1 Tax=Cucumis melo TaxID=3656 RepID=A0A9I9E8L7_CUCME